MANVEILVELGKSVLLENASFPVPETKQRVPEFVQTSPQIRIIAANVGTSARVAKLANLVPVNVLLANKFVVVVVST